jgi:hypothetical protein
MKNFNLIGWFVLFFTLCIANNEVLAREIPGLETEKSIPGITVSPQYVIVDDYAGVSLPDREWYYSRLGSDRGEMGDGSYTVNIGGGNASVAVQSGWAGVWCYLKHNSRDNDVLNPIRLLGPYIKAQYQPRIVGIEVKIIDGVGLFKIELKDINNDFISWQFYQLTGGSRTLSYSIEPSTNISRLNWLINEAGYATVDEIRLLIESPDYNLQEAVFLFSYNHLSQCYDEATGVVRDRARWPAGVFDAVQSIGTFALASAVAWDLGYIEESTAKAIITKTKNTILALPTYHGLLPHFLENGNRHPNSEWSSVDTVITLIAEILACQAVGEDTSPLEAMMQSIDWNDLTDNGAHSIGMGYSTTGEKLKDTYGNLLTWNTFGSEAFLVAAAYSAATGNNNVKLDGFSYPATWDGSGFNDQLAALFFPMNTTDKWGNDWWTYRQQAFVSQLNYINNLTGIHQDYKDYGLFGLSAAEVPEPWMVEEGEVYRAWGVGGHNGTPQDGINLVGYPIIAPHYAAMVWPEHPDESANVFRYLMETHNLFTPLNNVESLGIDIDGNPHWNSLKGSWNLSLQALGISRDLSNGNPLAYRALSQNDFLYQGFGLLVDQTITVTSPNGGENWQVNTTWEITWSSNGIAGNVKLEYSTNNGSTWTTIISTTANDGSYHWTIPDSPSSQCLVRVSEAADGSPVAASDAVFSIHINSSNIYIYHGNDYTANNKADISVYRPSTGYWYTRGGSYIRWGIQPGDIPVPGDYNGDGTTDIAVYRPANGYWYIRGVGNYQWGIQPGDIPVPGDYNKDGKTDIAVYRPSNGYWYIKGVGNYQWGIQSGDIPVPGDYNGDNQTDIAVYRPSNGYWYIKGIGNYRWGIQAGDIPVPGDYDGNGTTDIAIYRHSDGYWYIRAGSYIRWGIQSEDIPVQADYNGDGKFEIAVFRPSNGTWYIRGVGNYVWGIQPGDIPVTRGGK